MNSIEQQNSIWQTIRAAFGRGLVVIIPVVITVWVLNILFSTMDGITSPVFDRLLGQHVPGVGFVSMVVLIFVVGVLSRNLFGAAIFRFFERIIISIPLARTIYSAMKDLIRAFQPGAGGQSFRQVVLIEYPRHGVWAIGFVTNSLKIQNSTPGKEFVTVYIPNPPNPTSGMLVLIPRENVQVLSITVEEGLKLVLSGGIVTPKLLSVK